MKAVIGDDFEIDEMISNDTRETTDEFLSRPDIENLPVYKKREIWSGMLREQRKKQRWSPEDTKTN